MTPTEKLQAEAEQLYPYHEVVDLTNQNIFNYNLHKDGQRAAHVACAEKYTAIIEGLKQKHEERILILALDMQNKDQEIERLRNQLSLISGELDTIEFDPPTAVKRIRNHVTNALKTPTP